MISIIHPSRGRPEKSLKTIDNWLLYATNEVEIILSNDNDDPLAYRYITAYTERIIRDNRSCVDAINKAAEIATGNIFVVVSDDTDCFPGWDEALLKELEGKEDYLLKTDDGIQDYIVTMTVMDRKYYERDGFIYHPDFFHQFADTYLTCLADIRGRLLFSKLKFPHLHYSYSGGKEAADALNHRNDATWKDGQDTFVRLMKQFTPEERSRITNKSMRGFMKHVGL